MGSSNYTQTDNGVRSLGIGKWLFYIYKPEPTSSPIVGLGPFEGYLSVGKDFHFVFDPLAEGHEQDTRVPKCIAAFPSQNVAYVINVFYTEAKKA